MLVANFSFLVLICVAFQCVRRRLLDDLNYTRFKSYVEPLGQHLTMFSPLRYVVTASGEDRYR